MYVCICDSVLLMLHPIQRSCSMTAGCLLCVSQMLHVFHMLEPNFCVTQHFCIVLYNLIYPGQEAFSQKTTLQGAQQIHLYGHLKRHFTVSTSLSPDMCTYVDDIVPSGTSCNLIHLFIHYYYIIVNDLRGNLL